ncbi:MAG: hypothetical protein QW343_00500 [Candidatus Norongarragalinales archaeon]
MKENSKRKTFLALAPLTASLFYLAFVAFAVPVSASSKLVGGTLSISGLKYSPYPAEPGKYIDFFIGLDNGAYPIYDVECKLDSSFPFSVDDPNQAMQKIAYLPVGQGAVLKYKVRVADNAVTGYNDLVFSCRSRGADWVSAKMQVYVQVQEAILSITQVKITPSELKPGDKAVFSIKLENTGNSPIKDVSLKLAFTDDQPFTAIGSSNTKRIALVEPKGTVELSFDVLTYPDAAIKAYRIPLELAYYSANGTKTMRTDYTGVLVESKPEISIALESATLNKNASFGSIIFNVINKGVADAKFLEVEVLPVAGFRVLAGEKIYVGALDSDDYQAVEVKGYAETAASELRLPVALRFKDANNRAYEEKTEIVVPIYSQSELEKYGLAAPQGIIWTATAAVVVLAVAWLAYSRFVKKKKGVTRA